MFHNWNSINTESMKGKVWSDGCNIAQNGHTRTLSLFQAIGGKLRLNTNDIPDSFQITEAVADFFLPTFLLRRHNA